MSRPPPARVTVIAASTPFAGLRLSEQHLAVALSAAGHPVLYLDPPRACWSRSTGLVSRRPVSWSVRQVNPLLTHATLGVPPGLRSPAWTARTDRLRSGLARRLLRRRGDLPAAVISAAGRVSVFEGFGSARTVFWAKDDYVAGAGLIGLDSAAIADGQSAVAHVVHAAVAVSPALAEVWAGRVAHTELIPAGSDPTMAAAVAAATPAPDVDLPRPVVGFVGQISDRVELALLEAVADTGVSLLLVGRQQPTFSSRDRFAALVGRSNVQWVGARGYDELPGYLALIDVGLIPYTDSAFNRASFPLKLLEYLSVGAAVVSTDLPAVRWLDCPEVTIATAADYAAAVTELVVLATTPGPELAAARAACRSRAAEHSWEQRAARWADLLGLDEES